MYFSAVKSENIPVINYILKNEAYQADDYPGKFVIKKAPCFYEYDYNDCLKRLQGH